MGVGDYDDSGHDRPGTGPVEQGMRRDTKGRQRHPDMARGPDSAGIGPRRTLPEMPGEPRGAPRAFASRIKMSNERDNSGRGQNDRLVAPKKIAGENVLLFRLALGRPRPGRDVDAGNFLFQKGTAETRRFRAARGSEQRPQPEQHAHEPEELHVFKVSIANAKGFAELAAVIFDRAQIFARRTKHPARAGYEFQSCRMPGGRPKGRIRSSVTEEPRRPGRDPREPASPLRPQPLRRNFAKGRGLVSRALPACA